MNFPPVRLRRTLDFPTGPPGAHQLNDVMAGNPVIGGKGVFVEHFPLRIGRGQLTPVHLQRLLAVAQGDLVDEAIGHDLES